MFKTTKAFTFMGKDYKKGDVFPDELAKFVGSRVEGQYDVKEVVRQVIKSANKAILNKTKGIKVTKK